MSVLPSYRREIQDEESAPLYNDSNKFALNDDVEGAVYPPRSGQSSSGERSNVKYTFVPRWPIKGETQNALGVLGRTKEETIDFVQRAFVTLAAFPPDRVEFLAPMQEVADNAKDDQWGLVMDEAWPNFQTSPPTHLRVQVRDQPGDEALRKAHIRNKHIKGWSIGVSAVVLVYAGVLAFIWYCGGFE